MRGALAGIVTLWLVWGFNWTLWRLILPYTGPLEFIALRAVLVCVLLVVLMLALRRSLKPAPFVPLLLIGLLQGVGMNALSVVAVADSGATKATIFAYTMPFWTVLFARLILHEEIRFKQWIGIALGAFGLGFFIVGHSSRISELGAVFAIVGGICWALGTVVWKRTISRQPVDPWLMITWQNLFAIVPLGVAALLVHERPIVWNGLLSFVFFYNVVVTAVVAWLLWYWVVRVLSAVMAGMSALAIPVVAIISAYFFVGERPEPLQWIGIAAMLMALLIVNLPSSERDESSPRVIPSEACPSRSRRTGGQGYG